MIGYYTLDYIRDAQFRLTLHLSYHLLLKHEARKILMKDDVSPTLQRRIKHTIGAKNSCEIRRDDYAQTRGKRAFVSIHYDAVAEMVIREFPALAPYVIRKRMMMWTHIQPGHMPMDALVLYHVRKRWKLDTLGATKIVREKGFMP